MNKKPLIVYFHRYPPEYERIQYVGMEDLIDELRKTYRIIYFGMNGVIPKDKEFRKKFETEEIDLEIDTSNDKDKWIKTFLYYLKLPSSISRLKKLNPKFVICKETLPFIPFLVGRTKIPMLVDISDWWLSYLLGKSKIGKIFAENLEKIEVRKWNHQKVFAIAHSKAEANIVAKKGMSPRKIIVINAPMNEKTYFQMDASKEREKIDPSGDSWILATHGVIHPSKGYDQILKWWKKIVKAHPKWKFLIIGGAGGEKWCRNEITRLGLKENVIMTGWLDSQVKVNKYLNASDCLLATRRNTPENQGIITSALFHNLMVGKPTLASGLPGNLEIITHGKDGYIFKPDNYESFKNTLEHIYNNPEEGSRIAQHGITRAKECFNPTIAAIKWREAIDEAIKS